VPVGLPDFDHGIFNRSSLAIGYTPFDPDPLTFDILRN
jgi:hypothetical protein